MTDLAIDISTDAAIEMLDVKTALVRAGLVNVAQVLSADLLALAQAKASGNVLQVRTGRYLRGLTSSVAESSDGVVAQVSSDAPGAGFLEQGGEIPAHDILPTVGQALRFLGSAGAVYASVIHDPGARVAPHRVLGDALDEMSEAIESGLETAVTDAWA